MSVPERLIAEARAALRRGDASAARAAAAPISDAANGDVVEVVAVASYLELDYPEAIAQWERAHAAHRSSGDEVGAIRIARTLASCTGQSSGIGPSAAGG